MRRSCALRMRKSNVASCELRSVRLGPGLRLPMESSTQREIALEPQSERLAERLRQTDRGRPEQNPAAIEFALHYSNRNRDGCIVADIADASVSPNISSEGREALNVSFVIVAFRNDVVELELLMSSLLGGAERAGVKADLVVVLNDESKMGPIAGGTIVQGHGNVGFAAGIKLGVQHSRGDYVIIVNPDCAVDDSNLARFFQSLVPGCGVVTPILRNAVGEIDYKPYENWTFTPARKLSEFISKHYMYKSSNEKIPYFVKVPGAFIGLERQLAVELDSPFDPAYFLYGEDRDLTNRLRIRRVPMRLLRDVTITHIGGESGKTVSVLVEKCKSDSAMRVAFRRYGRVGAVMAALDLAGVATVKGWRGDSSLSEPRLWAISRWRAANFRDPGALNEKLLASEHHTKNVDHEGQAR